MIFYIIVVPVTVNDIADTSNIRQGTSRIPRYVQDNEAKTDAGRLPLRHDYPSIHIEVSTNSHRGFTYAATVITAYLIFSTNIFLFLYPPLYQFVYILIRRSSLHCNCLPIHIEIRMHAFTHCYIAVFRARV